MREFFIIILLGMLSSMAFTVPSKGILNPSHQIRAMQPLMLLPSKVAVIPSCHRYQVTCFDNESKVVKGSIIIQEQALYIAQIQKYRCGVAGLRLQSDLPRYLNQQCNNRLMGQCHGQCRADLKYWLLR